MKQIKVTSRASRSEEEIDEYYDYSWLTMNPVEPPGVPEYSTPENYGADLDLDDQIKVLTLQLKDLRNQIKLLKRELKMHIDNCPYGSIKGKSETL